MHAAKPSTVLESRLCPKCNNLRTCTSMNSALTGLLIAFGILLFIRRKTGDPALNQGFCDLDC